MPNIVEKAKITSKGQVTLPKAVRSLIGVRQGDSISFEIRGAEVLVRRHIDEDPDPMVGAFLAMIEKDITENRSLSALPAELEAKLRAAAQTADVSAVIDGDVAL